jgi:hypothetical protein
MTKREVAKRSRKRIAKQTVRKQQRAGNYRTPDKKRTS